MATGNAIVFESLTKENYEYWSVLVRNYLKGKGIWHVVDPKLSAERTDDDDEDGRNDDWQRNNFKALHIIQLACGSELVSIIQTCLTARDAWIQLKDLFSEKQDLLMPDPLEEELKKLSGTRPARILEAEGCGEIYRFVKKGDVSGVRNQEHFIKTLPIDVCSSLVRASVIAEKVEIVKLLVSITPKIVLQMEGEEGYTPLALAVYTGNKRVAEVLLSDEDGRVLLRKEVNGAHMGLIPVVMSADMGHKEMTRYLYALTPIEALRNDDYRQASMLISECINNEIPEVALHVLQSIDRESPLNHCDRVTLLELAYSPCLFYSGTKFQWWQQWIYNNLKAPSVIYLNNDDSQPEAFVTIKVASHLDLIIQRQTKCSSGRLMSGMLSSLSPLNILGALLRLFQPFLLSISAIKHIYERKLLHRQVIEILRCLCERISTFNQEELEDVSAYDAMLQAAKNGIIEIIQLLKKAKAELVWESVDKRRRGVFAYAILFRRKQVFELIHELPIEWKKLISNKRDTDGNSLLHLVAMLPPSFVIGRGTAAGLQIQRELQWFKAVEESVNPKCKELKNNEGKMAEDVFEESHEALVKEAEKWAKDTAGSFTIVGALIITITFAAAFTVPGGSNQDTGKPTLLNDKIFTAFIIADTFGLFSSSSSVLIFIGVLTSRYTEQDFLISLPRKLLFGLLCLSVSVVSMFVAFCAALFLTLPGYCFVSWSAFTLALVTVLLVLVPSQFGLFSQIFGSTLGFNAFRSQKTFGGLLGQLAKICLF